jgi:hypothetical protein
MKTCNFYLKLYRFDVCPPQPYVPKQKWHGNRSGLYEGWFNTYHHTEHRMSWTVQDVRWTGTVTQHSDTSLEHDGTFSLDGSTTIPQGSTIALLVNGWQPLIPMSSMMACWSCLNRFCSWNAASQVLHTVPIYSNMLSLLHISWLTAGVSYTRMWSASTGHIW